MLATTGMVSNTPQQRVMPAAAPDSSEPWYIVQESRRPNQLLLMLMFCVGQVSEKILLLDAEAKELRLAAAAADDRAEVLAREKMQVMGLAEELRADVAAKMALLDEFEARFARQYR